MSEAAWELVRQGEAMRLERRGPIMRLVLDRGPANEIGLVALADLEAALDVIDHTDARVLLIESALPTSFSAGADLRELQRELAVHSASGRTRAEAAGEVRAFLDRIHAALDRLDMLPLTTIAALHGVVMGGGFELALACDLRVADQSTRFAFPELRLGLVPGWGGTVRLKREAPPSLVRDLLLTGRTLGAERAYTLGLVSQVVPRGEAEAAAWRMAEQCARFLPGPIAQTKRLTKRLDPAELAAEKEAFIALFSDESGGDGGPVARALATFVHSKDVRPYMPSSPTKGS
ncbi:MAG: enoyl-CoA hydratase/isomerase family protein [Deltaproteobacteria bacterium]|nr:enoyl-CoA hydratase/isomerase family protein [Deltaproteobacteria bacterium]